MKFFHSYARVVQKAGVDLGAIGVFGAGESFLDRGDFFRCDAFIGWLILQARTSGSNLQPRGSEIMPSATPSLASHCFIRASMNRLRSLSLRNLSICGLPDASLGAAWL